MMPPPVYNGYLLLADISGYTPFMAETELLHSTEIIGHLLEGIVERLTPVFTIAEVEGDAVFAYAPAAALTRGETLVELIEVVYAAFQHQLVTMHRQTTCTCRACQSIPALDLKFVVHCGQYVLHRFTDHPKPMGSDVNLAHRLLKNHVTTETGSRAYALFTEPAVHRLGMPPAEMAAGREQYESFDDVTILSLNLHDRYTEISQARPGGVPQDAAHLTITTDVAAPPPVVWDWLHDPGKRNRWMTDIQLVGARLQRRTGPGTENHCVHGKRMAVERILAWCPFDSFTAETLQGVMAFRVTIELMPITGGTRVEGRYQLTRPRPRWLAWMLGRIVFTRVLPVKTWWAVLAQRLAEGYGTQYEDGRQPAKASDS